MGTLALLIAACGDDVGGSGLAGSDADGSADVVNTDVSEDTDPGVDVEQTDAAGGDASEDDATAASISERCQAAFATCAPALTEFAATWCATLSEDDACGRVVLDAFAAEGCFSACEVGIPGLATACLEPECASFITALTASEVLTDECSSCACIPDCEGRDCGPDGCGSTCGTCEGSAYCDVDQQCAPLEASCGGITPSGCCAATDQVVACDGGTVFAEQCEASTVCAWLPQAAGHVCIPSEWATEPPAWLPSSCPDGACIPTQEICDGLSQQCSDVIDADDPDAMCEAVHAAAPGVASDGGWACEATTPGEDGCRIAACENQFYNLDGSVETGCECAGTPRSRSLAACSNSPEGFLGSVFLGQTVDTLAGSVPRIDNGIGAGDEDWYSVHFPTTSSALGTVEVEFIVNEGLDYRFQVFTGCNSVAFTNLGTAFGAGAPPARQWRFGTGAVGSANPGQVIGQGSSLGTVYIRVFRVQNNNTCNDYQLRVRRF